MSCKQPAKDALKALVDTLNANSIDEPLQRRVKAVNDYVVKLARYLGAEGKVDTLQSKEESVIKGRKELSVISDKNVGDLFNASLGAVVNQYNYVTEDQYEQLSDKEKDFAYPLSEDQVKAVTNVKSYIVDSLNSMRIDSQTNRFKGTEVTLGKRALRELLEARPEMSMLLEKIGGEASNKYKISNSAVLAVVLGTNEYLAQNESSLNSHMDNKQLEDAFGDSSTYTRAKLGMGGVGIDVAAFRLGENVLKELGMRPKEDTEVDLVSKITASLGLVGIKALEREKVIAPTSVESLDAVRAKLSQNSQVLAIFDELAGKKPNNDYNVLYNDIAGLVKKRADHQKRLNSSKVDKESKDISSSIVRSITDTLGEYTTYLNSLKSVKTTLNEDDMLSITAMLDDAIGYAAGGVLLRRNDNIPPTRGAPDNKRTDSYVVLNPEQREGFSKLVQTKAELFSDLVDTVDNTRKPKFEAKERYDKVKKRRAKGSQAVNSQEKFVQLMEETGYKFNEGSDYLNDLFSGNRDTKYKGLITALGWKEVNKKDAKHKQIGDKSRNDKIEKLVTNYLDFLDEIDTREADGKSTEFFFEWFIPKNNRSMADTNTLDLQTGKELERWITSQAGLVEEVDAKAVTEYLDKGEYTYEEFGKLKAKDQVFILGTVQAFEGLKVGDVTVGKVDGDNINTLTEGFVALSKLTAEDLKELVKTPGLGHLGFKAVAASALDMYRDNKDGKFESSIMMEVDGLTNALYYKTLQNPAVDSWKEHLEKVGVLTEEQAKGIAHMGDKKADKSYTDVYQGVGGDVREGFVTAVDKLLTNEASRKDISEQNTNGIEAIAEYIKNNPKTNLILPYESVEKALNSAYRNVAKDPTMTVNYAAGMPAMMSNVNKALQRQMLEVLVSDKVSDATLMSFFGNRYQAEYIKKIIREQEEGSPVFEKILRPVLDIVPGILGDGTKVQVAEGEADYVGVMDKVLGDKFGKQMEAEKEVVNYYNILHEMHQEMVYAVANDESMTLGERKEALRQLKVFEPVVIRPDSIDFNQATVITKNITKPKIGANGKSIQVVHKHGKTETDAFLFEGLLSDRVTVLERKDGPPGATAAPTGTHTQDNKDITTTVMDVVKEVDTAPVATQIFDAMVVTGESIGASKKYNENSFLGNLQYNAMEDLVLRAKALQDLSGEIDVFKNTQLDFSQLAKGKYVRVDRKKYEYDYLQEADPEQGETSFAISLTDLEIRTDNDIVPKRAKIFSVKRKVMQMGGTVDSEYDYDPDVVKRELKDRLTESTKLLKELLADTEVDLVTSLEGINTEVVMDSIAELVANENIELNAVKLGMAMNYAKGYEQRGQLLDIIQDMKSASTGIRTIEGTSLGISTDFNMSENESRSTPEELAVATTC